MYTGISNTARWNDTLRADHARTAVAVHTNLISSSTLTLDVEGGTVTDDATSNVRRVLSCTVPSSQATWDALDTVGGEVAVTQTIRYVDGQTQSVPMGVFILDSDQIGYGPGDTISLNQCPDRWGKVQKNTLPPSGRASVRTNTAWQEIKRLVEGAWAGSYPFPGWSQLDTSATAKVGSLVWDDGNREAAILDLCATNSVEVLFDRAGLGVLRPVPVLTTASSPVWTVNAGQMGVMVAADRTRDRSQIRNVIIVSTGASDVTFVPVEVKNTTVGDPLSTSGPLGYMAQEYSSPLLRSSAQAAAAGKTMLAKTLGVAKQLSLEAAGNPALDAGDVITVALPQIDANSSRPVETHILDTISHPLEPSGTQSLSTRSTRPATDGS
jgi:hypothetical protein